MALAFAFVMHVFRPFGLTNDQWDLALGLPSIILYGIVNMIIRRREKEEAKAN